MMFSFGKKTVFRDYREYTTDEIRDVASRLLNENRRDDWQHTQYVKHVADGLQPYFKDCVGGCYENIDEMNMRDCGKVLLWCDNLHAVRKRTPPVSEAVVPPYVSGDDVTTQKLEAADFCKSYAHYYNDRDAFHFKLLVDTLERADKYTVFGARTGGIVKMSKQLGFTNMNFIERSAYCRQMIENQFGVKCVDDSHVEGVLIFFDTSHRTDLHMYKYLGEDKSILVYDHAPYYLGCYYLTMTGHTSDYRYATNLSSYLRVGSDLSPPNHPLNVDLRLFDQFEEIYLHTNVAHMYTLLKIIDPLHKLGVRFFGDGSSKYNALYVTSPNVRSRPALFIIDQDVGDLHTHFRRGDVIYSLCLSHIIDNKFINENVALLCQATPYEVYRLGLICDEMTLYDMSLKNGFVVPQSNDFHVRTSRWYMLQDGANIRFSANDGTSLSNVLLKKKHVLGYDMFCVARPCVLEFDCNALNCNYECSHVHTVVVSEHGRCDYFSSLLLKFDPLSQYPQLFRLNVAVLASINQTAEQRDTVLMMSDRMIRKKFGWIFNPSGRLKMYAPDVVKLKEMLIWCKVEMCDFFPKFFGLAMHYELDGESLIFKGFKCAVEDGKRMITCIDHFMPQLKFGTYRVVLYDKVLGRAFSTVLTYCCCESADGVFDDRDFEK